MGYYRNLYVGPILRLTNPIHSTKIHFYTYFDQVVEQNLEREDDFQILQRHVGGCRKNETWIRPAHFDTIEQLSDEEAYALSESDPEQEKLWLSQKFQKEIDILKQHYTNVVVDWAIVVDGS